MRNIPIFVGEKIVQSNQFKKKLKTYLEST